MSIYLYLKEREVEKISGFKDEITRTRSGDKYRSYTIPGNICLALENGRFHLTIGDEDSIPSVLADIVEEITYCGWIHCAQRMLGKYKLGLAIAEVKEKVRKTEQIYDHFIFVTSKSMPSLRDILHALKTGTIKPTESYERPQHKERPPIGFFAPEKAHSLKVFMKNLRWSLCRRNNVVKTISGILSGQNPNKRG